MTEDRTMEILERLVRIETMLHTNGETLNNKASIQDVDALRERVDKLESTNTWLSRSILGIVITAIMGLVILSSRI